MTVTAQKGHAGVGQERDAYLSVRGLQKSYGGFRALDDVSFDLPRGEFLVLLGPSGCGKTTTMRSIVGLESPEAGRISLGERVLFDTATGTDVPVNRRGVGMVFQSYAIWPHRSVFDNVAFPLRVRKTPRRELRERTLAALDTVGLAHLADRGASKLSGGQMQRIALARSIVMEPGLLLLDEPLSNLDAQLRDRLRVELKRLQQELGITTVYVTHDQTEALSMADRIAVMFDGSIHQYTDPETLYNDPATLQVASFLGRSNLLEGKATSRSDGTQIRLTGPGCDVISSQPCDAGTDVVARIRVEDVRVNLTPTGAVNELMGEIAVTTYLGHQTGYFVRLPDSTLIEAVVTGSGRPSLAVGDRVAVSFDPEAVRVYPSSATVDEPKAGPR